MFIKFPTVCLSLKAGELKISRKIITHLDKQKIILTVLATLCFNLEEAQFDLENVRFDFKSIQLAWKRVQFN